MNSLAGVLEAAAELQTFCTQQRWRSCVIGGLAVQRWGTPRFTQDADLTLLTGNGKLDLSLVRKELGPLLELKGEQGAQAKFEGLVKTVSGRMDSQA